MKIILLHGPNLNLIGSISSNIGSRITLDKINTGIKRHIRNTSTEIKICQTHKAYQAINFIQRNRNWADGILFAPMAWAFYEYAILDAIKISGLPTIQLLFGDKYNNTNKEKSIFTNLTTDTIVGSPEKIYIDGIKFLENLK